MEQQAPRVSRPPGSLSRFGRGKGPMRPHGKGEGVVGGGERLDLTPTKPLSPPGRGWVRGMRGGMLRDARPPHPALRASLSRLQERDGKASPACGRGEARVRRACGRGTSRFVPRMDAVAPPHPDPLPGGERGNGVWEVAGNAWFFGGSLLGTRGRYRNYTLCLPGIPHARRRPLFQSVHRFRPPHRDGRG
jgi:hypothetical protein